MRCFGIKASSLVAGEYFDINLNKRYTVQTMTTETVKLYDNITITELENSEIEIKGEIPVSAVPSFRKEALKKLSERTKIDGFRTGHIPEKILIEKIGEDKIMSEVAEMALAQMYPTLVRDKNLDVIGAPEVAITKPAPGNPIGFKIKSAILPKFTLPDYVQITKEALKENDNPKEDLGVTQSDVERVLTEVRHGKARFEKAQKKTREEAKKEGKSDPVRTDGSEEPTSNGTGLPELDDAFISTLGDFKTVADFEALVLADLGKEKKQKEKMRETIKKNDQAIGWQAERV